MDSTTIVIILSIFPAAAAVLQIIKYAISFPSLRKEAKGELSEGRFYEKPKRSMSVNPLLMILLLLIILIFGMMLVQFRIEAINSEAREEIYKTQISNIVNEIEAIKLENSIIIKDQIDKMID